MYNDDDERVRDLVDEIMQSDRSSSDGEIRAALKNASNSAFPEPLHPVDNVHWTIPKPQYVHFVAGVCQAYLDRIGYHPIRDNPSTTELEHEDLTENVARPLAQVLHRERLIGLANWPEDGCTLKTNDCAALVVGVCGATSYYEDHLTMRMLQNLSYLQIDPQSPVAFEGAYQFGLDKFREHAPRALAYWWP